MKRDPVYMKGDSNSRDAPLSPARQAWLMLLVIAPMAACYPAIKTGLEFAPSLRFAGLRTLVGGLSLLLVLVIFALVARAERAFSTRRNAGTGSLDQRGCSHRDSEKASPRQRPHGPDGLATGRWKRRPARFVSGF